MDGRTGAGLGTAWRRCALAGLLVALAVAPAHGLPEGFDADFKGCSEDQDEAERKRCCQETGDDCLTTCDTEPDPTGCKVGCLAAQSKCENPDGPYGPGPSSSPLRPLRPGGGDVKGSGIPGTAVRPAPPRDFVPPPETRVVVLIPKVNGKRLDWCLHWARDCGEPAATAYCRANGYARAERIQQDPDIGNTWVLGDRKVCKEKFCDGFKSIACVK